MQELEAQFGELLPEREALGCIGRSFHPCHLQPEHCGHHEYHPCADREPHCDDLLGDLRL